jgi:hypothetical protein
MAARTVSAPVSAPVSTRRPAIKQADLFAKFGHLERQREAGKLAERILRIVAGATDDKVGAMALEIAGKALEVNQAPVAPAVNQDGNNVKPA